MIYCCVRGFLDNTKPALLASQGWCMREEERRRWPGLVYIQTTDLTLMDYLGISAGGSEAGPGWYYSFIIAIRYKYFSPGPWTALSSLVGQQVPRDRLDNDRAVVIS